MITSALSIDSMEDIPDFLEAKESRGIGNKAEFFTEKNIRDRLWFQKYLNDRIYIRKSHLGIGRLSTYRIIELQCLALGTANISHVCEDFSNESSNSGMVAKSSVSFSSTSMLDMELNEFRVVAVSRDFTSLLTDSAFSSNWLTSNLISTRKRKKEERENEETRCEKVANNE